MLQKDNLKLLKKWIKSNQDMIFNHPNIQKQIFNQLDLELVIEQSEYYEEGIFYIIDSYFIRKFRGFITEKEGIVQIDDFELLDQTFYQKKEFFENVVEYMATHFKEEQAYIVDDRKKGDVCYYQKDEFGIYGPSLETTHYFKMKKVKKSLANCSGLNITYQVTEYEESIISALPEHEKTVVKVYR